MEIKQEDRIAAEVRSNLQLPPDQLRVIRRYVRRAINRIKAFCGRDDLPAALEDVTAQIVEDMLRADKIAPEENDVSSITRGDTSISYRDKAAALRDTVAFVKNYESQLIPFRRIKLPRDEP